MKKLLILILTILALSGCNWENPKWLLIEYPIQGDKSVMKFPGIKANDLNECKTQSNTVKEMRDENYNGKFQCGSNCRFSIEWGSPLCDELLDI